MQNKISILQRKINLKNKLSSLVKMPAFDLFTYVRNTI